MKGEVGSAPIAERKREEKGRDQRAGLDVGTAGHITYGGILVKSIHAAKLRES